MHVSTHMCSCGDVDTCTHKGSPPWSPLSYIISCTASSMQRRRLAPETRSAIGHRRRGVSRCPRDQIQKNFIAARRAAFLASSSCSWSRLGSSPSSRSSFSRCSFFAFLAADRTLSLSRFSAARASALSTASASAVVTAPAASFAVASSARVRAGLRNRDRGGTGVRLLEVLPSVRPEPLP